VSQPSLHGATPIYENAYKPEKVDSGERSSIAAKLFSKKKGKRGNVHPRTGREGPEGK